MIRIGLLAAGLLSGVVAAQGQPPRVLFVMSAADTLPLRHGKTYAGTGVFLGEFYLPYQAVTAAGYTVTFATPQGRVSPIDQESLNARYWHGKDSTRTQAQQFVTQDPAFRNPISLEEALHRANEFVGMVVPGGQGLMVDLRQNPTVPLLLRHFADHQKPLGLVCHAPALLLTLPRENHPFGGYTVNCVSGFEEFYIETFVMRGRPLNRHIARQLKQAGLIYRHGRPGKPFGVRDRMLITSQNPFSNVLFSEQYLTALRQYIPRPLVNAR